jgi:hypothetical protein
LLIRGGRAERNNIFSEVAAAGSFMDRTSIFRGGAGWCSPGGDGRFGGCGDGRGRRVSPAVTPGFHGSGWVFSCSFLGLLGQVLVVR